jgi:hypothetical protein
MTLCNSWNRAGDRIAVGDGHGSLQIYEVGDVGSAFARIAIKLVDCSATLS